MHNHCFQFLLGITVVPGEIQDNGYAKFGGVNKVHYGLCENGELYFGCQWFMQAVYFFFKLFQINRSTCKNLREKFLQAGLAVEMTAACLHRIS